MMLLRKTIRAQGGFTLLELLIAITIFAIGLLTVAGMQLTALRANSTADTISVATAVAQGILEDLLSRDADGGDYNSDTGAPPPTYDLTAAAMAGAMDSIPGGSKYSAIYEIDVDNPSAGMARVEVEVTINARSVRLVGFKRL